MNTDKILSDKDALDFIADAISKESLRFINKCLDEARQSLELYRDIGGVQKTVTFRVADVLALTFLKIKYPAIIKFLLNYFDSIENNNEYLLEFIERKNFVKETLKEEQFKLIKYIEHKLELGDLKLSHPELIEQIFSQSFRFWYDEIYSIDSQNKKIDPEISPEVRDDTFSNPAVLKSFLLMVVSRKKNPVIDAVEIYKNHVAGQKLPSDISVSDLINYSQTLRNIKNTLPLINLDVARSIFEKIFKDPTTLQPMGRSDDSLRGHAVYEFVFQILEIFEKRFNKKELNQYEIQAVNLLKEFLSSPIIDTCSKFIVINSFANTSRGGLSDINWRLNNAFDVMCKFDQSLTSVLRAVFKEYELRYITGDKILYESEENFFFVMFQGWSGYANNVQEIERIRKCALRGLGKNIEAIKLYWNQYDYLQGMDKYIDEIDNIKDMGITVDKFQGANIYLPLDELIKISKGVNFNDPILTNKIALWSALRQNSKIQEWFIPRDDPRTLKSILIQRGFLLGQDIIFFKDIEKESIEKYTKMKYPDKDISIDYQEQILAALAQSKGYKKIADIDKIVKKVEPLISELYKKRPDLFTYGTDFISKSLGLYDIDFMNSYPFVKTTKDIFQEIRQKTPGLF